MRNWLPGGVAAILLSFVLTGCGLLQPRPSPPRAAMQVTPFSSASPGGPFPRGWYPAALARFRKPTQYELADDDGITVVRAVADGSSSGMTLDVDIDPRLFPVVRWRWKVPRPLPGADNTRRETDDAPARVELVFAGDTSRLPLSERVFFAEVKAITGVDIPYATLDYSWGSGAPAGSIVVNTWTARIRSILVRSGPDGMGVWSVEERNVYDDFKAVFGEEPGRITQVVIWSDADATGGTAEAYYGDIEFIGVGPP